jgi:hypothetical protein
MSFEGEAPSAEALPGPMKVMARTVFALTHKVGAPDKEGNITSEMTYAMRPANSSAKRY